MFILIFGGGTSSFLEHKNSLYCEHWPFITLEVHFSLRQRCPRYFFGTLKFYFFLKSLKMIIIIKSKSILYLLHSGVCRLPHSELNWTQCDEFHLWFHNEYMNIPECVFSNSHDVEWMCKLSSSFQHFLIFFKYPTNYIYNKLYNNYNIIYCSSLSLWGNFQLFRYT